MNDMNELKSELDILKMDVSELKELFTVTFEQQALLLKNIDYVIQNNIKEHNNLKSFCDIFS